MAKRRHTLKTAFLDSSVLFTAVNSITGGSAKLFTLKRVMLVTSKVVLTEVERNVRKKLPSFQLARFFLLVEKITILDELPDNALIGKAEKVIAQKDAVILAEAKFAKTDFLLTLDQKHFFKDAVAGFLKPQRVLTPKMLFARIS